jgi:membrane fusion protein, adhesin transport system
LTQNNPPPSWLSSAVRLLKRLLVFVLSPFYKLLPFSLRRRLAALSIKLGIGLRVTGFFIKELFSYDADNRERLSTQLLVIVSGLLVIFVAWAAIAEFDQVVTAEAKVYPFSRLQTIEHFEGGRVNKIHIKQGDEVKESDLLISLSPIQTQSDLNVQKDNVASLGIRLARLMAEYDQQSDFSVSAEVIAQYRALYDNERALFLERRGQRAANIRAKQAEIDSAQSKVVAAEFSLSSSGQELEVMRQLVSKGLEPRLSLIRSEKSYSDAQGQFANSQQELLRAKAALDSVIQESQTNILGELAKVRSDFTAARESIVVTADKADRSEIRSPIAGVVNRVLVSTEGGTVKPGETVVEIVPQDSTIVVEASINPADIGFIQVGQSALVKLTAYDFSIFGALDGVVAVITADTITDEKGNQYYLIKVDLQTPYLKSGGRVLRIIPGMTAQVDIVTGKRTALEYVFSPIAKVFKESLREK